MQKSKRDVKKVGEQKEQKTSGKGRKEKYEAAAAREGLKMAVDVAAVIGWL